MKIEENLEIPPLEETNIDPSAQVPQLQLQEQETLHGEKHMHDTFPMHGGHPSQEGISYRGGPPSWFLEYFGKLNETMVRIEKRQ